MQPLLICGIPQLVRSKWTRPTRPDSARIWTLVAQPSPTQPQFGPWGPNLTQNWFQIGSKLGSFGFIKYIIGLNPNLKPIWGQPNPIGPVFFTLRTNLTQLNPNFGYQIGFNPKKRVGFGRTILNVVVVSTEYQARWNIWGQWRFVPTNFWQIS